MMNFKDWQKVSEDGKSVTLKHPKGHQMTIALKGLAKIQQEQLKRLMFAEGGSVDEDEGMSEQGKTVRHANKMKKRGEPVEQEMHDAKEEAKGRAKFEREAVKPKLKGLAEGGDPAKAPDMPEPEAPSQPAPTTVINVGAPASPAVQAPVSQSPPAAPPQVKVPEAKPAQGGLGQQGQNTLQAVEQGKAAIQGQGAIDTAKAEAQVPIAAEALKSEQGIAQNNANALKEIGQRTQQFNDWVNKNPIDPRHYQESMKSGQKVSAAIGLFLGGMGTPFGGHNYAFDHLQKQIDRDLEAQSKNVENQKSVLGAWQQLYGDNNISTGLAKASMNDIYAKKIGLAAAQLGTQQAAINAQQAQAKLGMDSAQLRTDAAGMLGSMGGGRPPAPEGQAQPAQKGSGKKEEEKKHPLQGTLLGPNAEKQFQTIQYTPKAKDQLPEITRQFTQAQQADKALRQVNDTFMNLRSGAENGGVGGRIHRTMDPHALPGSGMVGDVVKGLGYLGQQASNTDTNRLYDAQQSQLKGYISAALKGTNIGSQDIDDIVAKNSPEYGDSNEAMAFKLKTIREFIKNHTETSLLKTWGLTNE